MLRFRRFINQVQQDGELVDVDKYLRNPIILTKTSTDANLMSANIVTQNNINDIFALSKLKVYPRLFYHFNDRVFEYIRSFWNNAEKFSVSVNNPRLGSYKYGEGSDVLAFYDYPTNKQIDKTRKGRIEPSRNLNVILYGEKYYETLGSCLRASGMFHSDFFITIPFRFNFYEIKILYSAGASFFIVKKEHAPCISYIMNWKRSGSHFHLIMKKNHWAYKELNELKEERVERINWSEDYHFVVLVSDNVTESDFIKLKKVLLEKKSNVGIINLDMASDSAVSSSNILLNVCSSAYMYRMKYYLKNLKD